ncbi:MAG: tetratricopeptide repeat protein [Acidobacteriota bacterium]
MSLLGLLYYLSPVLTVVAVIDILRTRSEWWWVLIVLFFQPFGPLIYFALSYGPWSTAGSVRQLSPAAARRAQARRQLRDLQVQLGHWRGPAVLAEAGEQWMTLGKMDAAESHLREAHEAGAKPKDVSFNFAQVLQVRGGRYAESLPRLEELIAVEPDARFGVARLALARALDETGDDARAEEELRAVLAKRSPPEAKVRLARLLLRRGDGEEARRLLDEVQRDAATMPAYLKREHGPWIRAARRVRSGTEAVPKPRLEGAPPRGRLWVALAVSLGVLLVLFALYGYGFVNLPFG